jgi:hypothetical protein
MGFKWTERSGLMATYHDEQTRASRGWNRRWLVVAAVVIALAVAVILLVVYSGGGGSGGGGY